MPSTPTHGLRWPLSTDTPDVPRDLQNLAEDTDAAITNYLQVHARGPIPDQPVPNGTDVRLAASITTGNGITELDDVFTLTAVGYYMVGARVATAAGSTTARMYLSILQGNGDDHRSAFGYDENEVSANALVYSIGTNTVQFRGYQATGGSINFAGTYAIKYLGA